MVQSAALDELIRSLEALVAALHCDPDPGWFDVFDARLARARSLATSAAPTVDVGELARDVLTCYRGGMGSFNDYAPVRYDEASGAWQVIPGLEHERELADDVHDKAVALLTSGSDASL
jgi:hypothetical protein